MRNIEALKFTCNAICNTFYPDEATAQAIMFHNRINGEADATPNDPALIKVAIILVSGYIESSRSENGVSTSNFDERVKENIIVWCRRCGLDASEFIKIKTIKDGSKRW